MSGKYVSVAVHFVWSTADRQPYIHHDWSQHLYSYIGGILRNNNATLLRAGGIADHIHLLVGLPSTTSLADMVNAMKSNSSRWVRQTIPNQEAFSWQKGYGAFSVSKSAEPSVSHYISHQEEHHQRFMFKDEFLQLLAKHHVPYNERYIWE